MCFTFDTKHEAAEKKREIESAVSKNKYVPPAEVPTVKDAATDWLNGAKVAPSKHGGFIKESTIEAWANHINRYIVRTLGPVKMDRVDTKLVEKQRDVWKGKGLAARTINKVLGTLSAIFDKQIKARTISLNPVKLADRTGVGSNEVGEDNEDGVKLEISESDVYSADELAELFTYAEDGLSRVTLMFFALTGARHGEGLGLQWPDVDFDQQTVAIRRSWSGRYRNGEPIFHTPKTKGSRRVVPIPDELEKWQLRCPTSKWDLVFPKLNGRPQYRKRGEP